MPRKPASPPASPPVTGELPQPGPKAAPKPKRKPTAKRAGRAAAEKRPRGRPTELKPELTKALEEVFTLGATIPDACDYVGVDRRSYFNWMAIGRALVEPDETSAEVHLPREADRPLYVDFFHRIKAAQAKMRVAALTSIRLAAQTEWTAAAWLMERSDPKHWGRRSGDETGGPTEVVVRVVREDKKL